MTTKPKVGIELVSGILEAAAGADAIVTVCPMCQMNLEAYQSKASRTRGADLTIPVLYLPQLLGLALGLDQKEVRLDLNLSNTKSFQMRAA
jgi:heterodisulfide reductase subunit B